MATSNDDLIGDLEFEPCLREAVNELHARGGRPDRCVWTVRKEPRGPTTTHIAVTCQPQELFARKLGEDETSLRAWMSESVPEGAVRVIVERDGRKHWRFWKLLKPSALA